MNSFRVLFMGTPRFAKNNLEFLLKDKDYQVVGVVSQPDRKRGRGLKFEPSPVKAFAKEKGLEVLTPEKIDNKVIKTLRELNFDVVVVVAYGKILPQTFLSSFPCVVNVHASLLPKLRGAAPIGRALMQGYQFTGVALQKMVYKLDAGDVIAESSKIDLTDPSIDAEVLENLMLPLSEHLLTCELKKFLKGEIEAKPQDESQATYAHKITSKDCEINWGELCSQEIFNHIRGLSPKPGAFTKFKGKRFKVYKAAFKEDTVKSSCKPGQVIGFEEGKHLGSN